MHGVRVDRDIRLEYFEHFSHISFRVGNLKPTGTCLRSFAIFICLTGTHHIDSVDLSWSWEWSPTARRLVFDIANFHITFSAWQSKRR